MRKPSRIGELALLRQPAQACCNGEGVSSETSPAPADAEALVVVDGMTPGMPLGPSLRLTNPELHVSVFGGTQRPPDADWATVPLVAMADLPAPARAAVDRTIAEHVGDAPWPARRPPWFRHGWLEQVEDWIDDQLRSLTLVRARATVPVRVWSLSAVLQVPLTSGASVWFKATCEHFRAEPAITRAVGAFATSTVPTVLAADDERAWMLLAPLPPTAVDRARRIEATASAMAKVQLEATAHVDALRAAGCPDRGLQPTLDAFRALLAERESAARIWSWIEDQLGSFFDGGVPLSLVHGDLHLDNVAGDDRAVIYDWTDGCISHPFIDGAHLAREADGAHHAAVRDIYLAAWGNGAEATWELAPLADRVFQAVTHDAIRRSLEPASQWEVAGWMARLLVDLEQSHSSSQ